MMLKKKSNPWARLKYLYVLPLAVIAVAAFARPEISSELDEISAVKVNDLTAIMKTEEVKSPEKHPAKEIKVQGQVLEKSTNAPVVGANVIIKGTTSGTITDLDGNFVIFNACWGYFECFIYKYESKGIDYYRETYWKN